MAAKLKELTSSWELVFFLQAGMVGTGMLALYFSLSFPTLLSLCALGVMYYVYCGQWKRAAGHLSLLDKTVLITGCDTGFGHGLATFLHQQGARVIATVYRPQGEGATRLRDVNSERLVVLPLDVSSDDSVAQCQRHVKELCKDSGLWGLVNNAGHNFLGEMELTTLSQYHMVLDINIMGIVRTTRAFLPLLRQAKGRIVNVTSIKGQLSTPFNAAYNISKYGGETFSEITRMEVKEHGVKVVIVEPGNFGGTTNAIDAQRMGREFEEMWAEASEETKQVFSKERRDSFLASLPEACLMCYPTLTPVMNVITEALTSGDPDFRYIIDGSSSWFDKYCMLVRLKPFLSDRVFDQITSRVFPFDVYK